MANKRLAEHNNQMLRGAHGEATELLLMLMAAASGCDGEHPVVEWGSMLRSAKNITAILQHGEVVSQTLTKPAK